MKLFDQKTINLGQGQFAVLYTPAEQSERNRIGVVVMHSDTDYRSFRIAEQLASRGFYAIWSVVSYVGAIMDQKMREVGKCVQYLKKDAGVEKVVLFGHSGGATLMTAYQGVAENGPEIFRGPGVLMPCSDKLTEFTPADGVMLVDPNWGNGAMALFSIDPAVVTEGDGLKLDPELDLFNPANGFDRENTQYSDEFIRRFQKAQGERNNRIIKAALDRLTLIEKGQGKYADDEPFIVTGAASGFMNNKLYAQDVRLMSRTRKAHTLLHKDGVETVEVVHTLRKPCNFEPMTQSCREGVLATTVRAYLSQHSVLTTKDYAYDADTVTGIEWESGGCSCTTGNIRGVHVPLLVMGMTGSWEFACAETICERAPSTDKTLAYVEGAAHTFETVEQLEEYPGQFGDTEKTTYDFIAKWLAAPERFN